MKVKDLIKVLKSCAPDQEIKNVHIYLSADGEEAVDVMYKDADIEISKDKIESLKAALIAKEETHRIQINELKGKALNAFLECDGYDDFEREINS